MAPSASRPDAASRRLASSPDNPLLPALTVPAYPPLRVGETIAWTADTALTDLQRAVGPLTVSVSKAGKGDEVAPLVTVERGSDSVRMEGERVGSTYTHRISVFPNRRGAAPVVMLQSFSGGAHCCNHVQLAGISGGKLKVIELGSWDGDQIEVPGDLSHDGVADFVMTDQAFLYAFAPYAMSLSVPKVLNVVGGKVVDVSARPAFRQLYARAMNDSASTCRSDPDGVTRNGACAAYVAAAARAGRLQQAWGEMLAAYDAAADWELPSGCSVREPASGCPEALQIKYKSYPEALLSFLRQHGYVAAGWLPPEAFVPTPADAPDPKEDGPLTT